MARRARTIQRKARRRGTGAPAARFAPHDRSAAIMRQQLPPDPVQPPIAPEMPPIPPQPGDPIMPDPENPPGVPSSPEERPIV